VSWLTTSKLHQSLIFLFLRQQRHTATKNSTNYTSYTMEPRLHNAQKISQHSQLHNAYRNVNVGRLATNKNKYYNPNHFDISYFRNPILFSLLGYTFLQLITWTLTTITSSLCFLIWISWQWEPKLSLCSTISVLFVTASTLRILENTQFSTKVENQDQSRTPFLVTWHH